MININMEYFQFIIVLIFFPLIQGIITKLTANMQGRAK